MPYWFADVNQDALGPCVWQPCLETETGYVPCFETRFATKEDCEQWIEQYVVGAALRRD